MTFKFSVKLPKLHNIDPFYYKQTKSIRLLHDAAIDLTNKLLNTRNTHEAYDQQEGIKHTQSFVALVRSQTERLGPARVARILRKRSHNGIVFRADLERDITRSEVLQQNVEYELELLHSRKVLLIGWSILLMGFVSSVALSIIAHQASVHLPRIIPAHWLSAP